MSTASLKFRKPLSKKHETLLDKALELSTLSTCNFLHGAIITKGGCTVAVGINSYTNNPDNVTNPQTEATIHAEIAALNACRKVDLNGATIYVARMGKNGIPMMSKPCINCQKALKARGVKKVFYTVSSEMTL